MLPKHVNYYFNIVADLQLTSENLGSLFCGGIVQEYSESIAYRACTMFLLC